MLFILAAFNQEKALVGAFSVITNLRMELFEALTVTPPPSDTTSVNPQNIMEHEIHTITQKILFSHFQSFHHLCIIKSLSISSNNRYARI